MPLSKQVQVLIVDQTSLHEDLAQTAIAQENLPIRLQHTETISAALDLLATPGEAKLPNLIILNLESQNTEYLDLLTYARAEERLKLLPIVIMAPPLSPDEVLKIYQAGCNCYIQRPDDQSFSPQRMRTFFDFWLNCAELPYFHHKKPVYPAWQATPPEVFMWERPLNILLVDDDEGDIFIIGEILEYLKVKVKLHAVRNGLEALSYLRREGPWESAVHPDLILLDLNMPKMDGRQTLQEIRSDFALKHLPVLILTTSEAETDLYKSYQNGSNGYLIKPVGIDKLVDMLQVTSDFWGNLAALPEGVAS